MPRRVRITWRHRGGRKPDGVVVVARPTRWGNPYPVAEHGRGLAVDLFRTYAIERAASEPGWIAPLMGKDLACYCPEGQACHGDVLIDLAHAG